MILPAAIEGFLLHARREAVPRVPGVETSPPLPSIQGGPVLVNVV